MAVTIEFGGATRTLKFGLGECRELEQRLGIDGMLRVGAMLSNCSVTAAQQCLYVGLKKDEPSLNPNLVLARLDTFMQAGGNFVDLCTQLWEALEETGLFKVSEAQESGNGRAAKALT